MSRPPRASGGIGRRAGFRFLCPKGRGGSTPPSPTTSDLRGFGLAAAKVKDDEGWATKIEIAKKARSEAIRTRKGKPATFADHVVTAAYEVAYGCRLVVLIDAIFPMSTTSFEELIFDADTSTYGISLTDV
jgi:hypothetical protein